MTRLISTDPRWASSLLTTHAVPARTGRRAELDDLVVVGKLLFTLVYPAFCRRSLEALYSAESIVAHDYRSHVILGFEEGRHLVPIILNRTLAGVITRQREPHVPPKSIQEPSQVSHASENILARVEYVRDAEPHGSRRHQLHKPG